ncbi:putative protein predicted to be involved in C-type cytochrome biogenesis [Jannaschia seosinensis]|uniref:Thiol:disulfide interchange protein DsbD N-terminal domain-containing protein n=1 Tax=Jannaschia seosinensis TaxID=313367 RepID=A0A0M7BES3_9RHOB|nr:protein-disulfide reductase DsbD domain-containing protein [Jannaschia seosinensis]CUH40344.1 putative protein predicted to be involved in C-type cytochrome biogenesis [Jannaschia seosinensis]
MFRLLLVLLILLPLPAVCERQDMRDAIRVEVLPGWRREDGIHVAGLRVRLAPGWRTYWRSAGAAGISPQMDWRGSRGVRSVTPAWPTPTLFRTAGALSIGYREDFILPLLVATGNGKARLEGRLDIGVCADICLPARLHVAADLPVRGTQDARLAAALTDRPRVIAAAAHCSLAPTEDGLALTARMDVPRQGGAEAVVFELPDPKIWVTDAATARDGTTLVARSELIGEAPLSVDRSRIRITVIGTDGAVELRGCAG